MAASLMRLARSAPENPGVARATASKSTSGARCLPVDVDLQDGGPFGLVGEGDLDLAVEAARPQQRRIEHFGPVGGGHDDHAGGGVEAVHLGQELVQGLLALVVGDDRPASALADGVDLVDEDDRGGPLAGVGEEVADPRRPDADEELDEARAGEGEEGHPGLAGHRPGHEGLAGARWADHEHPAGADGPGAGVALGMAQEVDHLGHLTLGSLVAGDVAEAGRRPVLVVDLGLRAPDAHDPAGELFGAPPSDPDEEGEEQQEGEERTAGPREEPSPAPTPVTSTSWALSVGASWVSVMAVGIWLV